MRTFALGATWLALSLLSQRVISQQVQESNSNDDGLSILEIPVDKAIPQPQPAPVQNNAAVAPPPTTITPAPVVQQGGPDGQLTIAITNKYGSPVSMSFDVDAGSSAFVGNPQPTELPDAGSASYTVPKGWAGRVSIGKINHSDNSKIEGSFYGAGNGDIDISYVDGYSVPISCSVGGKVVTGCNMELFHQECNVPDSVSGFDADGKPAVCSNGARANPNGPASGFFSPCAGSAYTFPNDNDANTGMISETFMSCCIGNSCKPSPRQQAQKRGALSPRANSPSLLPRSHQLREALHRRHGLHVHKHQA